MMRPGWNELGLQGGWDNQRKQSACWARPRLGEDPRVAAVYVARGELRKASDASGFGSHAGLPASGTTCEG